jgi:hypothetical protein
MCYNAVMLNGLEIVANPLLAGCKQGIKDGNRVAVSPAYYELLTAAKTQKELTDLLASIKVVNIGPPEHDAQWHADDMQIRMAKLQSAFKSFAASPASTEAE